MISYGYAAFLILAFGAACGVVVVVSCWGYCVAVTFLNVRASDGLPEDTSFDRPTSITSGYLADDERGSDSSGDTRRSLTMPERQYLFNSGWTG
ncbi:hypothetical protein F5Y05DRAFT_291673 [Hypoxylon sp. FL0543]|nr:hypothetical protein F5Y05DRAFT_291673 [Hypoxylon sp. FL0543]